MRLHVAFRYNDHCGGMEKHVASSSSSRFSLPLILSNYNKIPMLCERSQYLSKWQNKTSSRLRKIKDYTLLNFVLMFFIRRNSNIRQVIIHGDFYIVLLLPFYFLHPHIKLYLVSHDRLEKSILRDNVFLIIGKFVKNHITTSGYNYVTYKKYFVKSMFRPTGAKESRVLVNKSSNEDILDICVVANDYKKKNITQYINLIGKCSKSDQELQFHHVGHLTAERAKKLLQLGCLLHGPVEAGQVEKILDDCDVLFCPSHREGTPKVFFEALSRGLCVYIHASLLFDKNNLYFGLNKAEFAKLGIFTYQSYEELTAEGFKEMIQKIRMANAFSEVHRLKRMEFANTLSENKLGLFYDEID